MVIVWLVLGVALLLFEMHTVAFYALFPSIGAFAAAVVALLAPDAIPVQIITAVIVSIIGVIAVRPLMSRTFNHPRGAQVAHGVHGGLVGQEAVTLDEVGVAHSLGHARLAGERWLAVSGVGASIPAGTRVLVQKIQGTTLVVLPVSELYGDTGEEFT